MEIDIPGDNIFYLDLMDCYKIICIQEIGNEMSALVLEDLVSRQIRFLRTCLYSEEETDSDTDQKTANSDRNKKLKLVQLGVYTNATHFITSPLLKYRAVSKIDPVTGKYY